MRAPSLFPNRLPLLHIFPNFPGMAIPSRAPPSFSCAARPHEHLPCSSAASLAGQFLLPPPPAPPLRSTEAPGFAGHSLFPFHAGKVAARCYGPPHAPPLKETEASGFAGRFLFLPQMRPFHAGKIAAHCYGSWSPAVVTELTWDECILKSDTLVVVVFWTRRCGPCNMVNRVIDEEVGPKYWKKVKFFRLNAEEDYDVAVDNGVEKVPTVVLFKNGKKIKAIVGTMYSETYEAAIESALASEDKK